MRKVCQLAYGSLFMFQLSMWSQRGIGLWEVPKAALMSDKQGYNGRFAPCVTSLDVRRKGKETQSESLQHLFRCIWTGFKMRCLGSVPLPFTCLAVNTSASAESSSGLTPKAAIRPYRSWRKYNPIVTYRLLYEITWANLKQYVRIFCWLSLKLVNIFKKQIKGSVIL